MYSDINLYFFLGIFIYLLLFYLANYKSRAKGDSIQKPGERVKILRLSIAALALSISLILFRPYWFPTEEPEGYSIDRILLLGTAVIALITLYISFRREVRKQFL